MHILGININLENKEINELTNTLKKIRENRNLQMLKKLNDIGANMTMKDISLDKNANITRAHFAGALVKTGFCKDKKEAFEKYLGYNKAAYVKREKLLPGECINLIHRAGGKAILAHLNQINLDKDKLLELLLYLKNYNLDGIEAYYFEYDENFTDWCLETAKNLGFFISAGSDYHGKNKINKLGYHNFEKVIYKDFINWC